MAYIFNGRFSGLADSKYSGLEGALYRCVGIDGHSEPGVLKVRQKLTKNSGSTITELCKVGVSASDGSRLWFSSESGKIWRDSAGTYTLVHTTAPTSGVAPCTGAGELEGFIYWATEKYLHRISVSDIGGDWSTLADLNFEEFAQGDDTHHPFAKQSGEMFIGDKTVIAKILASNASVLANDLRTTLGTSGNSATIGFLVNPSDSTAFPVLRVSAREFSSSAASLTKSITVAAHANRVLFVVVFSMTASPNVSAMTFNGDAMTLVSSASLAIGAGNGKYFLYRLIVPDAATGDVVATFDASYANVGMHILSFSGVDQTTPVSGNSTSEDSSTTIADITLAVTKLHQVRIATVLSGTSTHTLAVGQTEIFNTSNNGGRDSMSYIGKVGDFVSETDFDISAPERITALISYDIDILIGTLDNQGARALRWDTVAKSYSAEDYVPEAGIKAFIRDDNYVYAVAGDFGRIYFYNGEKLEPYKQIPGDWSPTKKAVINPNAVAFLLGLPIFGISNSTGNPVLQGVYSFGSYSKDYTKVLDLSYVISSDETSGMTIGAILVEGADMYVSWKGASTVGVDKLDYTAKYASAYLESMTLYDDQRGMVKTLAEVCAYYASLPSGTGVTFSYSVNGAAYVAMTDVDDTILAALEAQLTVEKVGSLQIKMAFNVSSNDAPVIEMIKTSINDEE